MNNLKCIWISNKNAFNSLLIKTNIYETLNLWIKTCVMQINGIKSLFLNYVLTVLTGETKDKKCYRYQWSTTNTVPNQSNMTFSSNTYNMASVSVSVYVPYKWNAFRHTYNVQPGLQYGRFHSNKGVIGYSLYRFSVKFGSIYFNKVFIFKTQILTSMYHNNILLQKRFYKFYKAL